MTGFVRAVAIDERLLLGARASPGDSSIALVDDARRHDIYMVLMSERTYEELCSDAAELPVHFDAVVAETGGVVSVGDRLVNRMPRGSRRAAVLNVLGELDIDPHDALGVCADAGRDLLDLEWCVTTVEGEGDAELAVAGADGLAHVLKGLTSWAALSPPRHNVSLARVGSHARGLDVVVPGGHANLLLCAADSDARDVPLQLAHQWSHAGYQTLILAVDGGSAGWSQAWTAEGLEPGDRLDLNDVHVNGRSAGWPERLQSALRTHRGLITFTVPSATGAARTEILSTALMRVRAQRQESGRPHWLLIDPVESVLDVPGLAPHVLDLNDRGHCLVQRRHAASPPWLGAMDVVQPCSPTCPAMPKHRHHTPRRRDDREPIPRTPSRPAHEAVSRDRPRSSQA